MRRSTATLRQHTGDGVPALPNNLSLHASDVHQGTTFGGRAEIRALVEWPSRNPHPILVQAEPAGPPGDLKDKTGLFVVVDLRTAAFEPPPLDLTSRTELAQFSMQ